MDHKKVASIDVGGELYAAEFNDVLIGGDVSGSDGTFVGTLHADALEVVDNINIAGNAVGSTYSAVSPGSIQVWGSGDGVFRDVIRLSFTAPANGMIHVQCQFYMESWKNKSVAQFRWDKAGAYDTYRSVYQGAYTGGWSVTSMHRTFSVTQGYNSIALQFAATTYNLETPNPRFSQRALVVDYVRDL